MIQRSDTVWQFLRAAKAGLAGLLIAFMAVIAGWPPAAAQTIGENHLFEKSQADNVGTISDQAGGYGKYKIAGLDVAIWKPAKANKAPLVIFSHGFGGSNTQSVFIMKGLSRAGYLVVAPNHKDAHLAKATHFKPEEDFKKVDRWSDKTYEDRRQDIVKLIQALHQEPLWDKQIDWERLALCGHSLGGYTMLGLGGAWPSWKLDGVKAILALSPYATPFAKNGSLDALSAPVMYQGGTRDFGITPFIKRPGGIYDKSSSPAFFVQFEGAGHFFWTGFNRDKTKQNLINHYCISFLDKYVRNDSKADPEGKVDGVSDLRFK